MGTDNIGEALLVAKTMTPDPEHLDTTVEPPSRTVTDLEHDGFQNAPRVILDDLDHLLHRLQTAHHP